MYKIVIFALLLIFAGCGGTKADKIEINRYRKESLLSADKIAREDLLNFFQSYKYAILSKNIVRIGSYIDYDFEGLGYDKESIVNMISSNIDAFLTYDVTLYDYKIENNFIILDAKVNYGTGITIYPKGWKLVLRDGKLFWYGHPY